MKRFIVSVPAIILASVSIAAGGAKTPVLIVRNPATAAARDVPLTLGHAIARGAVIDWTCQ